MWLLLVCTARLWSCWVVCCASQCSCCMLLLSCLFSVVPQEVQRTDNEPFTVNCQGMLCCAIAETMYVVACAEINSTTLSTI